MKIRSKLGISVAFIAACSTLWLYSTSQTSNPVAGVSVPAGSSLVRAVPPAQAGGSSERSGSQTDDWNGGCSAVNVSPFQADVPPGCQTTVAQLEKDSERADHDDAVFAAISQLQVAMANGDTQAAAQLLSLSHGCNPSTVLGSAAAGGACELASNLHATALGHIEAAAASGNADAKFHLANWLLLSNMAGIEESLANPASPPHEKFAEAEKLLEEAASGGSRLARDYMNARFNSPDGAGPT